MDSIIKTVLSGNWAELKKNFEERVNNKINQRIQNKKIDVLAKFNGVTREQMEESLNVSEEK